MPRIDTTEADVVRAVLARLRTDLQLPPDRCPLVTEPLAAMESPPPGGEYFLTVAQGAGSFPEGQQIGGGQLQTYEEQEMLVGCFTRVQLDRPGHHEELLLDARRGLTHVKRLVLRALVGVDLTIEGSSDTFLRQLVTVASSTPPAYDPDKRIGWQVLGFRVGWDWDLT